MAVEQLDETIGHVERLYRTVTGREVPPAGAAPYAVIPPEQEPASYVQHQLDRLLGLLGGQLGPARAPAGATPTTAAPAVTPPLSVWETPQELLLCLDLPGVAKEAVQLSVSGNTLIIAAERGLPGNGNTPPGQMTWSEQPTGSVRRTVPLPPGLALDQLAARLSQGVLEIRIPRAQAAGGTRQVNIQ